MNQFHPLHFKSWIEENRHLFKPPVGNKQIWPQGDFIVMVVGGPNERSDFHINKGPEFFYQLEGNMTLRVVDNKGKKKDIPIREGEIYLLPPNVPHSPQRPENSIGLVIERKRTPNEQDSFVWYCDQCDKVLYQHFFHLKDIEKDLPPVFQAYYSDVKNRTCDQCGWVAPDKE